jgi:tetratricopeptide (TPR) repeat protein
VARLVRVLSGCCLLLCALCAAPSIAAERFHSNPRAGADYYLETHGQIDPALLPRVYTVFARVLKVADKSSNATPKLIVVNDRRSAVAFVLADGSIVVSQRALDLVHEDAEPMLVDARLAFILGHELAHLADHDFWEHEVNQTAGISAVREIGAAVDLDSAQQKKELKADDLGFLYAALAGFRVDRLLQTAPANESFLSFWVNQIDAQDDQSYPTAQARTELLRLRLRERGEALHSFQFGSRLLAFGRYREAIELLREFQGQFPSREVFNNLGYAHLRLAVGKLAPEFAWHYWLPTLADLHTPLTRLTVTRASTQSRGTWRIPVAAREDLLEAARYFELATSKDPRYAPAHVNLAIVLVLMSMDTSSVAVPIEAAHPLLRAELALANAQALDPKDVSVRVLAQIVAFERRRAGNAEVAAPVPVDSVAPPGAPEDNSPAIAYNLARIHADTPLARGYWQKTIAGLEALPQRIRELICEQRSALTQHVSVDDLARRCRRPGSARQQRAAFPWTLPVQLSRDLLESPLTETERIRYGWRQTQLGYGKVFSGESSSMLALDDITTMIVLKDVSGAADMLLRCCSQPQDRLALADGELWRYDRWVAWIHDSQIREIWAAN